MIKSLDGSCDEIVIVDTGSDEATLQYEKRVADKFYRRPWQNDFAKMRNFAVARSSGEWIFSLDSDETASSGLVQALPDLIKASDIEGYKLPRVHYAGEPKPMKDYWRQLRLYRRHAHFFGAVHESIKNLKNIEVIDDFDLRINHFNSRKLQREKSLKYSQYLKDRIAQARKEHNARMVDYYQYKLWVQDNVYLLETDTGVGEETLAERYREYEVKKDQIEKSIKEEKWKID